MKCQNLIDFLPNSLYLQALCEISNGETDSVIHDIESFDFGTCDKDELIRNIQQQIRELKEDLKFHRNLKGKHIFFNVFNYRNKITTLPNEFTKKDSNNFYSF